MNGIIEIEGMEFFAFHGCYETERVVGNKFMVTPVSKQIATRQPKQITSQML